MKKTTLYIDIDDDIAAIIDKLTSAEQKIVALVLPKRPSTLQGSVNLQLLKRSAEDAGKNIVLITNDEQVMRLAGASGMFVSTSLQSKPYVPSAGVADDVVEELTDDITSAKSNGTDPAQPDVYAGEEKVDLSTPIGELAGDKDDEIDLDNSDAPDTDAKDTAKEEKKAKKPLIKVPNFGKFRTRLIAGGLGAILLVFILVWALVIAPKASVVLTAEKSDVQSKITVTASKDTQAVDAEKGLVPATRKEDKQKLTGTFTATGQKDLGQKASGNVIIYNCSKDDKLGDVTRTLPAGTGISSGSKTFIIQAAVTVEPSGFSGNNCKQDRPSSSVKVIASEGGDVYNLSARNYSVAGFPLMIAEDNDGMSGGTTKIVKVVSAEDIETAKAKVLEKSAGNVKGKLAQLLKDESLVPIEDTFVSAQGEPSSSVAVGSEATSDPTLTIEVTSSMLGMKLSDIEPLVKADVNKKIDGSKQKIYNSGLDRAVIAVTERPGADTVKLTVSVSANVGPNIDPTALAKEISGKKAGEAKQLLEARPGVSKADIRLSPFWVFSLPKNTSKITISVNE